MNFLSLHIRRFFASIPYKQILLFVLVFGTGYALAQGSPAAEPQNDSDVIRAIVQVLNLVFTLITFLLTPAIILAGWLLSPDWTMGDFFGLRPYFINVWVLVSNLVYIVFALMLLWMAVMQIFSGESNYAFKKKLPRFLVGIMIVPFTWLIVSWTLSFANQAVAAVLSIPAGAIGGISGGVSADGDKGLFHEKTIPTLFKLDFGEDAPGAGPETVSCNGDGVASNGSKCISPAEFIAFNEAGPFFIIMVYAYDIFKIQNTELVDFQSVCVNGADAKSCVNSILKLLRKFGVALITTVFFAIILIALCWVLLARAFKLWIYVMFSPLFGLSYAVSKEGLGETLNSSGGGGGDHGGGGGLGKVGFVPFFQLAMVPVLVSAVLSFGLLFIGVMNNTFTTGSMASTGSGGFCTKGDFMVKYCIEGSGDSYSSRLIVGNSASPSGGEYNITFEFGSMISDFVGNSAGKTVSGVAGGLAEGGTDIFAHIILSIIAIAVMWMGVKAAVSYDEVTRKAFEPFAKFGDSVGNFVQNIPSYLPTPHPALAAFNPATYSSMATAVNRNVDSTVADSRKSTADMLNGTRSAFDSTARDIDSGADKFNEGVKRFEAMSERDPKDAKRILESSLKTASTNILGSNTVSQADKDKFTAFQKAVETSKPQDIKVVLEDHSEIVGKLENGSLGTSSMKGIGRLTSALGGSIPGSSSSDNTKPFNGFQLNGNTVQGPGGGNIDYLIDLPHRDAIGREFPVNGSTTLTDAVKRTKLENLGFPRNVLENKQGADLDTIIASLTRYRTP